MVVKNRKKTGRVGRWKKGETGDPRGPKGAQNKRSLDRLTYLQAQGLDR